MPGFGFVPTGAAAAADILAIDDDEFRPHDALEHFSGALLVYICQSISLSGYMPTWREFWCTQQCRVVCYTGL